MSLKPRATPAVRNAWDADHIDVAHELLDLEDEFAADGESWSELDEAGVVIVRGATPPACVYSYAVAHQRHEVWASAREVRDVADRCMKYDNTLATLASRTAAP